MTCKAVRTGDQINCKLCLKTWNVNDPRPPRCIEGNKAIGSGYNVMDIKKASPEPNIRNWEKTVESEWHPSEEKNLRAMYPDPGYTFEEICELLGRSRGAVAGKANRLGLKRPNQ